MTGASAAFAAIDWGTTRLRAWLLDAAGEVLAERRSDEGLLGIGRDRFEAVLEDQLRAMGAGDGLPAVICGMAGSRQGWVEAPYVAVPARLDDLFAGAVRVATAGRDVRILPGVAQRDPARPDVMRGEETQLAGVAAQLGADDLLVCMPGTHCKWVELDRGTITAFSTWLTGELFSVLAQHSILKHAVGSEPARMTPDDPTFLRWLDDGLEHAGDATSRFFRIRASTLLLDMQPAQAAAALSGLLIGAEIASAKAMFDAAGKQVVLVASGPLGALYAAALARAGLAAETVDAEAAVRHGLARAARGIFSLESRAGG